MKAEDYLQDLRDERPVIWYHPEDRPKAMLVFALMFGYGVGVGACLTGIMWVML